VDRLPGAQQVGGHVLAHGAQADESDGHVMLLVGLLTVAPAQAGAQVLRALAESALTILDQQSGMHAGAGTAFAHLSR
jgi:hypothetical protein